MATALSSVLMAVALDSCSAWTQFSGRLLSVGRVIAPGVLRLTLRQPRERHSFPAFSFSFHRACLPIMCSASAADEGKIKGFLLDCDCNLVNSIPSGVSVTLLETQHSTAGAVTLQRAFDKEEKQPAGMSAIVAILSECKGIFWRGVEQRALPLSRQQSGVVAYFGFLGVNEDYRRQGVGAALVARAVAQLTCEQDYAALVAFCTSAKSRALFGDL